MFAVVIDRLQGEPAVLAKAASEVLGCTAYDVRPSVQGSGPAVIAVLGELERAEVTALALENVGLHASVVSVKEPRPTFEVRRFEFGEHVLKVEDRAGAELEVPYAAVEFLICATAVSSSSTTKTVVERKFSIGRSLISGGLVNTRNVHTKKTTRSTESEPLLFAYAGTGLPLRMAEKGLLYQGLGSALAPSRTANFQYAVDEIRRRCTNAGFDDRLRQRSVQTQMLGRTLSADEFVDFAVALVANSVRGARPLQGFR